MENYTREKSYENYSSKFVIRFPGDSAAFESKYVQRSNMQPIYIMYIIYILYENVRPLNV